MIRNKDRILHSICQVRINLGLVSSATLLSWIIISIKKNCYHLFKNDCDEVVGYVLWAKIDNDSLRQLKNRRVYPLYEHEWSDGNIYLILDVVFSNKNTIENSLALRRLMIQKKINAYAYLNSRRFKYFKKSVRRRKKLSCDAINRI